MRIGSSTAPSVPLIVGPLRCRWPPTNRQPPERYRVRIKDLEEKEAEVWFAYVSSNREHLTLKAARRMKAAKRASDRARAHNRRHSKLMHQIFFTTRWLIFNKTHNKAHNKVIKHVAEVFDIMQEIKNRPVAEVATRRGSIPNRRYSVD